ncbi:unnamed protein product, partial [Adineta steineri]
MEIIPLLETRNESIRKRNDNHLESFSLIWLNNNENVDIQKELRNTINHIETFDDVAECKNYIEKTSENDRLVLVTNGEFGQQIIPSIHQLRQISSIYINSEDKQWTNDFPKLKGIHVKMDELVSQIHEDYKNPRKIEEPIWMNMFTTVNDAGKSTTGINGQFAFSQLLLDCLLRLKSNENDRNELISYCEKEYEENQNELNHLHEFQSSYSSDNVLWWYTRESFFYKTLNAALRKENIHMIYLYRSFISDIQNQLQNHQCQYATRVYRSQLMSIDELNYLKNSVGQYVSVNSFLSTSFQKDIADFYLGDTNHRWIDFEKVLFEIDADPKVVTTKPFADISQFSDFNEELEVLFMLGSIFRLNSIIRDDENQFWIIQMCLCSNDEHNLKQVLMDMKNEIGNGETNLCILGKVVRRMGHLDLAKKYYYRCLDELSQNDPLLLTVYKDLAKIASHEKDYEEHLRLRHILAKIKEKIKLNDNEIETSEIDKLTYNNTVQKRKSKNYIRTPTCKDGMKNQDETDVDCGGTTCASKCLPQQGCESSSDCISNNCNTTTKKCLTPTCKDGIKNQDETDVDCGGATCPLKCLPQEGSPTCKDGVKNQDESDVDCGGTTCKSKCLPEQSCRLSSDCRSNNCNTTTKKCLTPTCTDGVKNHDETDVDCGGVTCWSRCLPQRGSPTCTDGIKNRDESDVDCGGAICESKCLPQQ